MTPEDQELQKLEQFLQKLSPAEPGDALTARLFAAFDTPTDAAPAEVDDPTITDMGEARRLRQSSQSWFQPFAAAAAVALIAGIIAIVGLNRPSDETGSGFVPTHAQNIYRGSNFDEIIYTDDRQPLQAVRHQIIGTYTWENPEDGSRVEIQVPVERIRYIPVHTD